ncbi:MAG: hypothetical protein HYZ49_12765 [Chloroflexi bacterium]|nr:hypothetical protein [Chloroflexota bacterium]
MPIHFDIDQWQKVKETYRLWWAHQLDRPIIPLTLSGRDPGRDRPCAPLLSQTTCHDFSIPAEDLIDCIDYELSRLVFLGDAFPFFSMDVFGPGLIAAFMGARLDNSTGLVWFFPSEDLPIDQIHFRYDPDNLWFRRIKEIYEAGMRHWQGQVLMSMTDLGGNLDILSTFRHGEKLPVDLYEYPDEVKRLTWEVHEAWHRYFEEINAIIAPHTPGYSDWSSLFYEQPGYMLQSDFTFMIGPKMFDEFAEPELAASTRRLAHSFYHLDGIGQLAHLDSILKIETLNGVQWVPGAGKPDCAHWPEVYQKIHAAGKLMQIFGEFDILDAVIEQVGDPGAIHCHFHWEPLTGDESEYRRQLARYGIE